MKENNEEKNLEVSGVIAKTEQYIKKNKKTLSIVGGAIVVVALAIWAYVALVAQPRQVRAAEDMFAAEQWFNEGDFEKALNGNDEFMGFAEVIDEYGCTKSGNLAKYYAGICQLNLGKYDEAIEYLKSYKGKDIFTSALSQMLIGDAYAEKGNNTDAVKYYEKAVSLKKARTLATGVLVDYMRIMLCLYTAIIKSGFKEIGNFDFSSDCINLLDIIAAMKNEQEPVAIKIGKKQKFDIKDLYCSDTCTFMLTIVLAYKILNDRVQEESKHE